MNERMNEQLYRATLLLNKVAIWATELSIFHRQTITIKTWLLVYSDTDDDIISNGSLLIASTFYRMRQVN